MTPCRPGYTDKDSFCYSGSIVDVRLLQPPAVVVSASQKHLGLLGLQCDDERVNEPSASLEGGRETPQPGEGVEEDPHRKVTMNSSLSVCAVPILAAAIAKGHAGSGSDEVRRKSWKLETHRAWLSPVVWSTAPCVRGTC